MKPIVILFFVGCFLRSYSQGQINLNYNLLQKDSFFLVCRGTKQKAGIIAGKFNISDKNATHVGIGIIDRGILHIYNVNNVSKELSALVHEDVRQFTAISDIVYFSIWKCKATESEIRQLKNILRRYSGKKIIFDMTFSENGDDNLYCSEFCAKVLYELNPAEFQFSLVNFALNGFYSVVLGRKAVDYYPVDFFQTNKKFKKIYEFHYKL